MSHSIAVVIPAYNAASYVCEALESVVAQSRLPEQIIVVDDGSTDRTAELVSAWGRKHLQALRLLRQTNQGVSAARNAGIRCAETDLVAFLDADDLFLPNHLERLERGFERLPHIILCFADTQIFSSKGTVKHSLLTGSRIETVEYAEQEDGLRLMRESPYLSLLGGSYIPLSATLCVKRALEHIGLFDEAIRNAEDRELWLRLSRIGSFAYYPLTLARKRVHANNLQHPRHTLLFQRYQFKVLQKMIHKADELGLSAREMRHTQEAIARQVGVMLTAASRHSLMAYLRTCIFLIRRGVLSPVLNPRYLLRALALSRRESTTTDWAPLDSGLSPPPSASVTHGPGSEPTIS